MSSGSKPKAAIVPLKWAVGDPCVVVRDEVHRGVVESIGEGCASVKIGEWRRIFCGLDELDVVPLPKDDEEARRGADGASEPNRTGQLSRGRGPDTLPETSGNGGEPGSSPSSGTIMPADGSEEAGASLLLPYDAFVAKKLSTVPAMGFTALPLLTSSLFSFQSDLVAWALRRGRAALFADTGLGKTAMQLEWAKHVSALTGKPVLILAPLAVAAQTAREGERLGIPVKVCRDGSDVEPGPQSVNVTNYDRLHRFDPSIFGGVVLDESSIIKHHDAKTLARLLAAFDATPYKLCATATPSPNDYTELGTHAEFLGICTRVEMLAEFFTHDGGETQKWRLKGHARASFWKWMSTWAALLRKPSDLGYDDAGYDLPKLEVIEHIIPADPAHARAQGLLFAEPAKTLTERRSAKKGTLDARVAQCAAVIAKEPNEPWIVWCELNAEADALTNALGPAAVEIRGPDEPHLKESRLVAFAAGEIRIMVTKTKIAGFGLNWQHCARMAFVGVNDSWESYYQAIRRCWRFGQKREVHVHIFASELEGEVVKNLMRKERDAKAMSEQLSAETRDAVRAEVRGLTRETNDYTPAVAMTVPAWMKGNAA